MVDLPVAEFTFVFFFFLFESGILSSEAAFVFQQYYYSLIVKLRNKSTPQSLKILTSCLWRNKRLRGKKFFSFPT